jgi:hypothetical protein
MATGSWPVLCAAFAAVIAITPGPAAAQGKHAIAAGWEQEVNWLPAPDRTLGLYLPSPQPPSIFILGDGSWPPPPLVPIANLRAQDVTRFGDKSLENVIRTDERYGHDGFFEPPRGWAYWNYLERPQPIQNPNLWPDMQATYFFHQFVMPAGSTMTLRGEYPHVRYLQFALYKAERDTFVSIGEDLAGDEIEPDPGSTNPFRVGADHLAEKRNFTLRIVAENAPLNKAQRAPNTLYVGRDGAEIQGSIRIYLPDQGWRCWVGSGNIAFRWARAADLRSHASRRYATIGGRGSETVRSSDDHQYRTSLYRRAVGTVGPRQGQ